jgi:hypothetical protein
VAVRQLDQPLDVRHLGDGIGRALEIPVASASWRARFDSGMSSMKHGVLDAEPDSSRRMMLRVGRRFPETQDVVALLRQPDEHYTIT